MGVKTMGGIVNSEDDVFHMFDLGVDGIMTDRPYEMLQFAKKQAL